MYSVNENYLKLPGSYLFSNIAKKVAAFSAANPDAPIIRLGIGDVTQPLAPAIISALKVFRNDCCAKTYSCKSGILRKTSKFDCTGSCSFTFKNTVWYIFLCDICFICSIINDHCPVFICIIYPFLEFIFCDSRLHLRSSKRFTVQLMRWHTQRHSTDMHRILDMNS